MSQGIRGARAYFITFNGLCTIHFGRGYKTEYCAVDVINSDLRKVGSRTEATDPFANFCHIWAPYRNKPNQIKVNKV